MSLFATITGTLQDSSGQPLAGRTITATLSNYGANVPMVTSGSTTIVVQPIVQVTAANDGTFSFQLYGNNVITPAGTVYVLTFATGNQFQTETATYSFTSNNTYNLNSYAPNVTYPIPAAIGPVNATQIQGIPVLKATPTDGQVLKYVSANGDIEWGTGGGTPGGSNTSIQYNDGGVFGGDAHLTWDKTAQSLSVTGITSIFCTDPASIALNIDYSSTPSTVALNVAVGAGDVFFGGNLDVNGAVTGVTFNVEGGATAAQLIGGTAAPEGATTANPASLFFRDNGNLYLKTTGTGNTGWKQLQSGVYSNTIANASHKWLNSYDATTGNFTQTQPDYSDLTGTPQLAQTKAAVASNFLTSYTASTGLFTAAQPAFSDISGTATSGQIPNLDASKITTGQLALARGGTNADLSATGGASQFLRQNSAGAAITVVQPAFTDISGTATSGQIPNLDASKITTGQLALARGGTNADLSATGGASNFLRQNSSGAAITVVQPNFTDLAGTIGSSQISSGTLTWDKLGNAAGALTLANAGNATTFNQTSAVNWTWANTTAATSGTSQSSPIFNINGTYWTGAASATDSWTIQDVVGNGTNGTSQLTFTHTGTTGASAVVVAGAGSAGNPALGLGGVGSGFWTSTNLLSCQIGASNAAGNLRFYGGASQYMNLGFSSSGGSNQLSSSAANSNMIISGNVTTSGLTPGSVTLNNGSSFTATSGTAVAVLVGVGSNSAGSVTFAPTSGSANFVGVNVNPTINQTGTSSGSYTGLQVNVIETALLGSSNKLLDLQAGTTGGVSRWSVLGRASTLGTDIAGSTQQSTANGGTWVHGQASELLTLSTSGLTTDTTNNLLPAGAIIEAVVCRVTTTITTTTNWAVGDSVQSARFSSPNATLTAGTTSIGLNQADPTVASSNLGPVQNSAAKVRITCTGSNPGAGAIRITVFYRQFVAPTS